jgi:hypothetical protein
MPRRPSKRRGRPPIFVRDDEGRVIYGLSSQTIIKGNRRRTRFYATFSDPRKWFGMDDLAGAIKAFFDWINANGWTSAYLRKTGQSHLIPRLKFMQRRYVHGDSPESEHPPEWLTGRIERSCPMGHVSISDKRAFFLPMTTESLTKDEAWMRWVFGDASKSLSVSTKRILAELIACFQHNLGRTQAEWIEEARQQLRGSTKMPETRIDELLKIVADWRPRS